ncbi:MAG: hypothetical protein ACK4XK_03815, partial [Casimicrobiaceae bacterium]
MKPLSRQPAKLQAKPSPTLAERERAARVAVFPELRNMGVFARALVLYLTLCGGYGLAVAARPEDVAIEIIVAIGASLPLAGAVGVVWLAASPWLRRLAYWQAALAIGLAAVVGALMLARLQLAPLWRAVPFTLLVLAVLLIYFHTLGQARSPAVT